jgi:predicted RNase H-like HicB family nuclease
MHTYLALIHKDPDSDYGVSFPDLPGCVTAGSSLDEAIAMAKEALALHVEGLLEDGEEVPPPTAADAIERGDALLIAAVGVPDNLRVERVNVTIPALALSRFDSFAERRGMSRSSLFVEAVQRWMTQELGRTMDEEHGLAHKEGPTGLNRVAHSEGHAEASLSAILDALSVRDMDQPPYGSKAETASEAVREIAKKIAEMAEEQVAAHKRRA